MKQLGKFADHTYAFMRIMAGAMFAFHGLQKLFGVLAWISTEGDSPKDLAPQPKIFPCHIADCRSQTYIKGALIIWKQ